MSTQTELLAKARHLFPNYRQPQHVMVRGLGTKLWDAAGREFLDFSGGIAVLSVGHCHPTLAKAVAEQAATLIHTSNLFYTDKALELAYELTQRTGFSRVYFSNSGTEANEALLKLARRWFYEHGEKDRTELIATHASFHGRTMGALALTGQPKYHAGMGPMVGNVTHIAYNDLDALAKAVTSKTAAVILEPVQAEGGIIVGTDAYLRGAREICDRVGALLFFDEVQTGFGRTGRFLGREWSGVMPDACSLAKGIGGGVPLGAIAVSEKLADGLPVGSHGSTFGGNPLACAAGLAVLRIFDEEGLVARAEATGQHVAARLDALVADGAIAAAAERRGLGLLQGVRTAKGYDTLAIIAAMREKGVLASVAGGDVVRLAPPLNVSIDDCDRAIDTLRSVLVEAKPTA